MVFLVMIFLLNIYPAMGSYYMFKKYSMKTLNPFSMELIIRSPNLIRPYVYRKAYTPYLLIRDDAFNTKIPPVDLKPISTSGFETEFNKYTEEWGRFLKPLVFDTGLSGRESTVTLSFDIDEKESIDNPTVNENWVLPDPKDKKAVRGEVFIGTASGSQFNPPEAVNRSLSLLSRAVGRFTRIKAVNRGFIPLDSEDLFKTPFIFIAADKTLSLNDVEKLYIARYIREGGFVFIERYKLDKLESDTRLLVDSSLHKLMTEILENTALWKPIPPDHLLFHCFYDFPEGASLAIDHSTITDNQVQPSEQKKSFLEGLWINKRLAVVYSDRDYSALWSDSSEPSPQVQIGVNLVVFALTQPGGMAKDTAKASER
ncbi:MAG: DUF4159 domain-containing protein [Candidatus Latescibacter sp.]|nr:DUF4159 domain-containing protein [Candidatus Latescibacter sp.]